MKLCWLGIHKWTKWGEPHMDMQRRKCKHCWRIETRIVWVELGDNAKLELLSRA